MPDIKASGGVGDKPPETPRRSSRIPVSTARALMATENSAFTKAPSSSKTKATRKVVTYKKMNPAGSLPPSPKNNAANLADTHSPRKTNTNRRYRSSLIVAKPDEETIYLADASSGSTSIDSIDEINDTILLASAPNMPQAHQTRSSFKVSIHNGPDISILFSSSLFDFIELLSMHIDFGKDDATLWYKYPADREWEPLGYNDEWIGLLQTAARKPGIIQIRRSEETDPESQVDY